MQNPRKYCSDVILNSSQQFNKTIRLRLEQFLPVAEYAAEGHFLVQGCRSRSLGRTLPFGLWLYPSFLSRRTCNKYYLIELRRSRLQFNKSNLVLIFRGCKGWICIKLLWDYIQTNSFLAHLFLLRYVKFLRSIVAIHKSPVGEVD